MTSCRAKPVAVAVAAAEPLTEDQQKKNLELAEVNPFLPFFQKILYYLYRRRTCKVFYFYFFPLLIVCSR